MNLQIQPTENRILVRLKDLNKTGLHIPDSAKVNPYAEVIAIGPDVNGINVGDKVLFLPSAQPIGLEQNDETVYVIPATTVFAKYV